MRLREAECVGSSVHSRVEKFVHTHGSHVVARTVVLATVLTDGTSVVMTSSSCTIGHVGGRELKKGLWSLKK